MSESTPRDVVPFRAPSRGTGDARESDADLEVESARGEAWFTDLTRENLTPLVRYFARRTAPQDAEDLASEVLLTAWRRRDDVPRDRSPLPWLYTTAGYVLANHRRKARPLPVEEVPEDDDAAHLADPALAAIADDEVRRALGRLSARDRKILALHAWEGLGGAELAEVLGISRGGADAALSRARSRLREAWDDQATG